MSYVDGFVIPLPKDKVEDYRKMSEEAGRVWMEHGALAYKECVIDDDNISEMRSFTLAADAQPEETVIFAYIVYRSREHRDEVNAKTMADPRLQSMCGDTPLFDWRRMAYGGFKAIVDFEGEGQEQRKGEPNEQT